MNLSITNEELLEYITCQVKTFFPDRKTDMGELKLYWDFTLQRMEYCFSKINSKYYWDGQDVLFNHLNADHYAMLLYFLSNTLYRNNSDITLCTKIFQLNRYLHGIDVYYEVKLPDIFMFVHPLGTVLGRANYSDYFLVYQKCNVGSSTGENNQAMYPNIKEYVTMHPGTSILGNCVVGKNCSLAAGALLLNQDVEDNNLYIGNPRDFIVKRRKTHNYIWRIDNAKIEG